MRRERDLSLDRRQKRVACAGEGDEEGVALGIDLVAAVRFEGRPQQALMLREHLSIPLPQLLDESRRPLDVGEEEGDRAARKVGHHVIMRAELPAV